MVSEASMIGPMHVIASSNEGVLLVVTLNYNGEAVTFLPKSLPSMSPKPARRG